MRRMHFFEFEDMPWFPDFLRNLMTDFLRHSTIVMGLHKTIVSLLHDAMKEVGGNKIVDLCSGGGGLLVEVQKTILQEYHYPVSVKFTDKYPNISTFEVLCNENPEFRSFETNSVDATQVPEHLEGVRTLFSAFHHFKPETAKSIIKNAVDSRSGIAIFEVSQRSLLGLIPMFLSPIGTWLFTPTIKPRSWKRFIFTYLIPLVPFFIMWDGIVSALRTYTLDEMKKMVGEINSKNYRWKIGKAKANWGYRVTYLIGIPLNQ